MILSSNHPSERNNTEPSSRLSWLHLHVSPYRQFHFCLFVFALFIATGVGLTFFTHYHYHPSHGQGFPGGRIVDQLAPGNRDMRNHLPLRQIAMVMDYKSKHSEIKRDPSSPPFYTCGDQQNSCEAFQQPIICCLEGMSCHSTPYTTSGVFCCNMTDLLSDCQPSADNPPQCPTSTYECSETVGGGCCPDGAACSENGCILFNGTDSPPPITSTITSTVVLTATSGMSGTSLNTIQPSGKVTTIVMVIGGETFPTATVAKGAEVAQRAEGIRQQQVEWQSEYFLNQPLMALIIAMGVGLF